MALLQFGTTLVFGVPPLWNNENQPDPNVRKFQAVLGMKVSHLPFSPFILIIGPPPPCIQLQLSCSSLEFIGFAIIVSETSLTNEPIVGVLGTIPTLTLAYVTAPFVHQVFLQIPEYARRSRQDLMHFTRTLKANPKGTANTKLEFVTLRIFPFRKHTTAFLHELRALPPMKMRLANIELPKTEEWAKRQREKGIFRRMAEVVKEPRFKFYVKEGRLYTMKTGVPGVWEEVAQRIQDQTAAHEEEAEKARIGAKRPVVVRRIARPVKLGGDVDKERVKRHTSRPVQK